MTHQPAISFSISFLSPFNRAGGRTSNVLQEKEVSLESFNDRNIENRSGKIYVDSQCLDCDLCREIAPTVFKRLESEGYSYVAKQPETAEEFKQVAECLEGCCTQAIHDDGDEFDWNLVLPLPSRSKDIHRDRDPEAHCGLVKGSTPTSIGGAFLQAVFRWFRRK